LSGLVVPDPWARDACDKESKISRGRIRENIDPTL
jgi:hypothetical protein